MSLQRFKSGFFRLKLCLSICLMGLALSAAAAAESADSAQSHYNQGMEYQQAGALQAAESAYLQALKQTPDLIPARYNLALLYFEQGQLDAARQHVDAALAHWLVDADLHALSGAIAQARKQPEAAQAAWDRACQLAADHAVCAMRTAAAAPLSPAPAALQALRQGETLQHKGHLAQATTILREAARLDPRWASPAYLLGLVLQQQGQTEAARRAWQEALRREPGHIGAYEQLAKMAQQAGDHSQARHYWLQALQHRPRFSQGYAALAEADLAQGQTEAALRWRTQLHQLSPEWPGNRLQLATLYHAQGQMNTARALLQEAGAASSPAEQGLLAHILLAQGETEAARLRLEPALRRWPHHAQLQSAMAAAYLAQNQLPQARHYLGLALSQAQPPAAAYALRGQLALQEQELQQGVQWLQRAVQANPSIAHYEALIFAQLKAGQPAAAAETVLAAQKRYPGHGAFAQLAQTLKTGRFSRKGRY